MNARSRTIVLLLALLAPAFTPSGAWCKDAPKHAWPGAEWERAEPAVVGMDAALLRKARDYALTGGGSGIVTRHGRLVLRWGDQQRWGLHP